MRYKANITDILRCSQKDDQFSQLYANELVNIVRLCGNKYQKFTKNIYPTTQALYYWSTSLSKLQTLGEEYTGILRVNRTLNKLPHNSILWFLLYIGGERIFLKILHHIHVTISKNNSLTPEAKSSLLELIKSIENNKDLIYKCHQVAFYLNGKYYSISNRITGIRYMCLRDWMADDYYAKAFSILGRISFLYLLCSIIYKLYNTYQQSSHQVENEAVSIYSSRTGENCFLCGEVKVNPCALTCSHIFCWNCIFSIISHDRKCPVCREIVYPSRVILLQNY